MPVTSQQPRRRLSRWLVFWAALGWLSLIRMVIDGLRGPADTLDGGMARAFVLSALIMCPVFAFMGWALHLSEKKKHA